MKEEGAKFYDADGNFDWKGASSSGSSASEMEEMGEAEIDEIGGSAGEISEMTYSDEVSGVWSLDEE